MAGRRAGATAEQVALRLGAGKAVMADLRAQARAFVEAEDAVRAKREMRARAVTRLTLGCGFLLVVLLGGFAAISARRQIRRVAQTYRDALIDQRRAQDALRTNEARLRAQAHELREADRRKDEFLAMLSHELRNPLAPIRNCVHILNHAAATGEDTSRAMAVMERQVEHLTSLVDDLLDVTRIARGKIELRRERLDLGQLVRRTGEDHWSVMRDRDVELLVHVPGHAIWMEGDPARLSQVVGNLLSNACKFTRARGEVTLTLALSGDMAEIRVRDSGVGIDPALLPHVFEPFVQAERSFARTEGGLGLGLALVRAVTELHGGSVQADSGGMDKGSEFTVRLPLRPPPAMAEAAHGARPGRVERARRVLVVDDNRDSAESLAHLIELFGHRTEIAHDGAMAISMARANPPDVIMCDIGLPQVDGYQVARTLRSDDAFRETVFVAVSGYARPEDVKKAVAAGFAYHVAKPPNPDQIESLLA
jgi:signal transduction histidine kinase